MVCLSSAAHTILRFDKSYHVSVRRPFFCRNQQNCRSTMVEKAVPPDPGNKRIKKPPRVYQEPKHSRHYVAIPRLNGLELHEPMEKLRRERNYTSAVKTMTATSWFNYTVFGILDNENPHEWYRRHCTEPIEQKYLRLVKYLKRLNQDNEEVHPMLSSEVFNIAIPF